MNPHALKGNYWFRSELTYVEGKANISLIPINTQNQQLHVGPEGMNETAVGLWHAFWNPSKYITNNDGSLNWKAVPFAALEVVGVAEGAAHMAGGLVTGLFKRVLKEVWKSKSLKPLLRRSARMRVASYPETDEPVIKLVASDSAGNLVQVGERTIIEKGQFVNRMFDSRAGQEGAHVSGPLGRSFSPGSGIPTTASEGIQQRGLNIFYPNNAQEAIIYRATESIPAIQRPSIGGTVPEILIEPQYWDKLEVVRQFSVKP